VCLDATVAMADSARCGMTFPDAVTWFVQQLESSGFVETHRVRGTMGTQA